MVLAPSSAGVVSSLKRFQQAEQVLWEDRLQMLAVVLEWKQRCSGTAMAAVAGAPSVLSRLVLDEGQPKPELPSSLVDSFVASL